jgi:hypothetical protein
MRVDWVHPSWRDLVIEELAADAELRRRFLAHCGVDGASLALSDGGGATGERTRPLVRCDADWDALGDGLHRVCEELDQAGAVQLLAVLEGDDDELRALRAMVLERLERRWQREVVGIDALEAWTESSDALPAFAIVAAAWLELAPERAPRTPVELERFADWIRLAELLRIHGDDLLERFGFPTAFGLTLDAFLREPHNGTEPEQERELRRETCRRLATLDPPRAGMALEWIPSEPLIEPIEAFELRPMNPLAPRFAVDRVLRDLVD